MMFTSHDGVNFIAGNSSAMFVCILLCFLWETHSSSDNAVTDWLMTVVDVREQLPYLSNRTTPNYRIAVLPPFHTLSISFDLKISTPPKGFLREDVLCLESNCAGLAFILSGWGEFRIMHCYRDFGSNHEVNLLEGNLVHIPLSSVQRFRIDIVEGNIITLSIASYAGRRSIHLRTERTICEPNERTDVWFDRQGLKAANVVINNVVITLS